MFKRQGKDSWDGASFQKKKQLYRKPDNFPKHSLPPSPQKIGLWATKGGVSLAVALRK